VSRDGDILLTDRNHLEAKAHLNIFRVIWGDRKTANFDEHMTAIFFEGGFCFFFDLLSIFLYFLYC